MGKPQAQVHASPDSRLAGCVNNSAMPFHDTAANRQTDSRTGIFPAAMQPLEWLKYLFGVLLFETDAIVPATQVQHVPFHAGFAYLINGDRDDGFDTFAAVF